MKYQKFSFGFMAFLVFMTLVSCEKEPPINHIVGQWHGRFVVNTYQDTTNVFSNTGENNHWIFNNDQTGEFRYHIDSPEPSYTFLWIYSESDKEIHILSERTVTPSNGEPFPTLSKTTYQIIEDHVDRQHWYEVYMNFDLDSTEQITYADWYLERE